MSTKYDVFLSYASADDTNLADPYAGQSRWVMCFKVALEEALNMELGRTGAAKLFFDAQRLQTGDHLDSAIKAALDETKIFVALASPAYFHPESWCKMERHYFTQRLATDPAKAGRIFTVLLDDEMLAKGKEEGFEGVLDFSFYEKNEATARCRRLGQGKIDGKFIERASELAKQLAARIRAMDGEESSIGQPAAPVVENRGTVVLAVVPGDVEDRRSEIADFLRGAGWRVVPERNECETDRELCRTGTEALCRDAKAFIQLLHRSRWTPIEYDRLQFAAAKAAGTPIFRYRGNDYAVTEVSNLEHRAWLQDADARTMPAIKKEIAERLAAIVAAENRAMLQGNVTSEDGEAYIRVSTSPLEKTSIGKPLADRLVREGVYPFQPADPLSELEKCFEKEHGFIAVFGNEVFSSRLEPVLMRWRELLMKCRSKARPPIAIYLAGPPTGNQEESINVCLPKLRTIHLGNEEEMKSFVEEVKTYVRGRQSEVSAAPSA